MNQVYINWRAVLFSILSIITLLMLSLASIAQGQNTDRCANNCFETSLIDKEVLEDGCINYQLSVSFEGKCSPALSHYSLGLGCGMISAASNSEGWPMELNSVDPTTGLGSLKVDEIQGFGDESDLKSFEVSFTFCPTDCAEDINCFSPAIAYKAGTCVFRDTLAISCVKPLNVIATANDLKCATASDGMISLAITGGDKPYTINWFGGQKDSVIYNLSPGLYSYEVISLDSQVVAGEVTINTPESISILDSLSLVSCANGNDGQISVSVTGGVSPYSYSWSNGDSTAIANELTVGNYTVIVTDANGCDLSRSFSLGTSSNLSYQSDVTQPNCSGAGGAISLTVSGGQSPFTYTWTNGAETANLTDLSGGEYSVIIEDANGCTLSETFLMESTNNLVLSAYASHTNCNDDAIGAVSLNVYGGTSPYTFVWSDGSITEDLSNVASGTYEVVVTDANGCQATTSATVRIRTPYIYGRPTAVVCDVLGSITTNVYYAEQPISYSWSTGDTTRNLTDLESGNYELTITDANGCSTTGTFYVAESHSISVKINENMNSCDDSQEAVLTASVSNGSAPYAYLWNTGDSTTSITPESDGQYTVTVVDANGCSNEANFDFTQLPPEVLSCDIIQGSDTVLCGSEGNYLYTDSNETGNTYVWTVSSSDGSWQITSAHNAYEVYYTAGADSTSATFNLQITTANGCTTTCSYELNACVTNDDDTDNTDDDGSEEEDNTEETDGSDESDDGSEDGEDDSDDSDGDSDGDSEDEDDTDESDDDVDNPDDDGSGDGDSDPANGPDKECTDCFETNSLTASEADGVYTYKFEVNVSGDCNFDLSHFTLALPACVGLVTYSNSEGWKMEVIANDPTTGLSGIKVDDIDAFKETGDTFEMEISFTLTDDSCDISCWSPTVAYKAAQCVIYQEVAEICINDTASRGYSFYPNPTTDQINIITDNLTSGVSYTVALYNDKGSRVAILATGTKEVINTPLSLPMTESGETRTYYLIISGDNDYRKVERLIIRR